MMNVLPKSASTTSTLISLLELARLRLRERLQSKFLPIATATAPMVPTNSKQQVNGQHTTTATNAQPNHHRHHHLEAARARLQAHFQNSFKTSQSLGDLTVGTTAQNTAADVPTLTEDAKKKKNNLTPLGLEAARDRIRERYQRTFRPDFEDFPHTLSEAMASLEDTGSSSTFGSQQYAILITHGAPTYRILAVNSSWEQLCEFSQHDALHHTIAELGMNSSSTSTSYHDNDADDDDERNENKDNMNMLRLRNKASTKLLLQNLERGQPTAVTLVNQTGTGRIFTNYLRAVPLWDDHHISSSVTPVVAFLGVVQDVSSSAIKPRQEQHQDQ